MRVESVKAMDAQQKATVKKAREMADQFKKYVDDFYSEILKQVANADWGEDDAPAKSAETAPPAPVAESAETPADIDNVSAKTFIAFGDTLKATRDGNNGIVEALGIRYSDKTERDLVGDYFTPQTDFGHTAGNGVAATLNHRIPLKTADTTPEEAQTLAEYARRFFKNPVKTERTPVGIVAKHILDLADDYERRIFELVQKGKLRWSSGTAAHLMERAPDGQLKTWHIAEWAYTPTPAEPRLPSILPIKTYRDEMPGIQTETLEAASLQAGTTPATAETATDDGQTPSEAQTAPHTVKKMEHLAMDDFNPHEAFNDLVATVADLSESVKAMADRQPYDNDPGYAGAPESAETNRQEILKSIGVNLLTDPERTQAVVKSELATAVAGTAKTPAQLDYEQRKAFLKYIYNGTESALRHDEIQLLRKSAVFPDYWLTPMLAADMSVSEIVKAQAEATGALGGFLVPTSMQQDILVQLANLTAVRQRARVLQLLTNATTYPRVSQKPSGWWGNEYQNLRADGLESNTQFEVIDLETHNYGTRVQVTRNLLEDAPRIATLLSTLFAEALATDEETAFLTGSGAGQPRGLLPGGLNAQSLGTLNTGNASALTTASLKRLKRRVRSVYRNNAVYIMSDDAAEEIELLTDPAGNYAFEVMGDDAPGTATRRSVLRAVESESMPDVAANAFPVIYGDLSGYTIVERAGMTIQRFQDTNTGINMYEYQLRRRVGGDVTEPYKFAALKVAA